MNTRHKYFRNLRYKQKLETNHDNGGYASHVYFITKEPDTRAMREDTHFYLRRPDVIPGDWDKRRGHDYFMYFERPEVPYSIAEHHWGRNGWKKVMKWQTARRNRRIRIKEDDVAVREKSFYKKYEDRWNYIYKWGITR
jgi:hypothetical protein